MARIEVDPGYTGPTFSRATASTDLFKKEDVQQLAAAVSTHVHDGVHGLGVAPAAATIPGSALTNGSVTLAKLAADSVDSSKIVNGTIATVDLADASVTNAKLAADTARANLLTNGGFEIWQRGNGPFTATGAYAADRWAIGLAGTDTLSVSRDTTNIDTAGGSRTAAACTFALGTGAGASALLQNLMTVDGHQLLNRVVSASVRVRTTTANAVRLGVYNGSAYSYSAFHSGGGAYETLTVTLTVTSSATTVQPGIFFAASCTAYIDNAMLVVGSVAADYAPLHPADDLARCLRYYELVGSAASAELMVGGIATGASQFADVTLGYKAMKALTPTVTKTGTWTAVNTAQPTTTGVASWGFRLTTTCVAAGQFYTINNAAGAYITSEANP